MYYMGLDLHCAQKDLLVSNNTFFYITKLFGNSNILPFPNKYVIVCANMSKSVCYWS